MHVACRDLLNLCLAPPAVWAPYPAGVTALTPQQFAQYSRIGMARGWPDILVGFGKMYGIELKTRRGRLSKTRVGRTARGGPRILEGQEDVFPRLIASGAFAAIEVARSVDEVCALLDTWGIPRKGGGSWRVVLRERSVQPLDATFAKRVGGGSA